MKRFVKAVEVEGYHDIFAEHNGILNYLALGKLTLKEGQSYSADTNDYEVVLVILSGVATVSTEGNTWVNLGGRKSVFDGKATAVYVSCQSSYHVTAQTDVEIAVCKAKAEQKYAPFVVTPDDIVVHHRGKENWQREVHDIIERNGEGRVHRIVIGETFNKAGQWSSYPPHKHDGEHYPEEPDLEEVYYYQVNPEQGFGVQLHYTKDLSIDDAYIIRHGDSFAIDQGYHPVAAAGGYEVYYLWFLAGKTGRNLKPYDDPDHSWLNK
ncbi:myo-inositol catabolism protein IolB [Caldalkalibacillus thermarum TA2.A1]|uniref:5-deoxy-glucuronate isomerase n=1 Tax=Caldalkalibacillus thermarum (strain TA2.A1) TaxID=986075 RepID=F5LAS8_CALTT|nr:5-deoxy-glucuronate isomerase [Caldalkalibacillus thermarum]EGL81467.1 myo-inositol catabolism protein IolB [Caldalkalibacillus thermarum TA2.A1]QZT33775.1 5-deoxy-glucuronate isomerase [Caldalkalibacillus thermarum TA2.A1]